MTQEDKKLLLIDLCARLPYGVKASYSYFYEMTIKSINVHHMTAELINEGHKFVAVPIEDFKPYLRPLSSMTEEERKEYQDIEETYQASFYPTYCHTLIDWLNKKMFAYRTINGKNMFELGLALVAPKGMY